MGVHNDSSAKFLIFADLQEETLTTGCWEGWGWCCPSHHHQTWGSHRNPWRRRGRWPSPCWSSERLIRHWTAACHECYSLAAAPVTARSKSVHQSASHTTSQPVPQSHNQSASPSATQPVSAPVSQSLSYTTSQPVHQPHNQSHSPSVTHSVCQSTNPLKNQTVH